MIRPGSSSPTVSPPALAGHKHTSYPLPTSHTTPAGAPLERQLSAPATRLDNQVLGGAVGGGGSAPSIATSGSMREGRRLSLARLRSRSDTRTNSSIVAPSSSSSSIDRANTGTSLVSTADSSIKKEKPLMSLSLAALLVYTIGVKWRGKLFFLFPCDYERPAKGYLAHIHKSPNLSCTDENGIRTYQILLRFPPPSISPHPCTEQNRPQPKRTI